MSYDLQVVQIVDVVPVRFVNFLPELEIPTLEIRGKDFRNVSEVRINDIRSPSYVVMSKTTLYAEIPSTELSSNIRNVQVLSSRFTATYQSLLRMRVGRNKISGIERLVQLYVRQILTTPGTDIFNKSSGGGLRSIVGTTVSKYAQTQVTGQFSQAVQQAASQLIAQQAAQTYLPPSERLLSAEVEALDFDINKGEVRGRVQLTSMAGESTEVALNPSQDES